MAHFTNLTIKMTIQENLKDIESIHDVRILLAVESGSRAWGFESKNSDWDVRFIYVHKPEWYLKIEEQRDVIERMDGEIDLVGWELRKALRLLKRSNPSFLEWIYSPIVYYTDNHFLDCIRKAEKDFFNPISSMYHYSRIYIKHDERYLQKGDCSMKKFLYYLRGILACKWIELNKSLPPVAFSELVDGTVDEKYIRERINDLILLKKDGEEHDMLVVDKGLIEYARHWADYFVECIGSFKPEMIRVSTSILDSILCDMVFLKR